MKNSGVTLTEILTRVRYDLSKRAATKYGKQNVWSSQGEIAVKTNDIKHSITTLDEFYALPPIISLGNASADN